MKMTSAYANKLIRQLNEDRAYWSNRECEGRTYVAAEGETPVIPDYDYGAVCARISEIDRQIRLLKHAVNRANVEAAVSVGGTVLSVDSILVKMSQLNDRKNTLDLMRKLPSRKRLDSRAYTNKVSAPEYQYVNYDIAAAEADYQQLSREIMELQLALDRYNQTVEFEVEGL